MGYSNHCRYQPCQGCGNLTNRIYELSDNLLTTQNQNHFLDLQVRQCNGKINSLYRRIQQLENEKQQLEFEKQQMENEKQQTKFQISKYVECEKKIHQKLLQREEELKHLSVVKETLTSREEEIHILQKECLRQSEWQMKYDTESKLHTENIRSNVAELRNCRELMKEKDIMIDSERAQILELKIDKRSLKHVVHKNVEIIESERKETNIKVATLQACINELIQEKKTLEKPETGLLNERAKENNELLIKNTALENDVRVLTYSKKQCGYKLEKLSREMIILRQELYKYTVDSPSKKLHSGHKLNTRIISDAKLEHMENSIAKENQQIQVLELQVQGLQAEISTGCASLNEREQKYKRNITNLEQSEQRMESRMKQIEQKLQSTNYELENAKLEISKRDKQIHDFSYLQQELSKDKANAQHMSSQMTVTITIDEYKNKCEEQVQQIHNLQEQLSRHKENLKQVEHVKTEQNQILQNKTLRCNELQTKVNSLQNEISKHEMEVHKLLANIHNLEEQSSVIISASKKQDETIKDLQKDKHKLTSHNNGMHKLQSVKDAALHELHEKIISLNKQVSPKMSIKMSVDSVNEAKYQKMKDVLRIVSEEFDEYKIKCRELGVQVNKLQQELEKHKDSAREKEYEFMREIQRLEKENSVQAIISDSEGETEDMKSKYRKEKSDNVKYQTMEQSFEMKITEVDQLNAACRELKTKIKVLENKGINCRLERENMMKVTQALGEKIKKQEIDLSDKNNKLEEQERERQLSIQKSKTESQAVSAKLSEKERIIKELEIKLHTGNQVDQKLKAGKEIEIKHLQTEIVSLKTKITNSDRKLQEIKSQMQEDANARLKAKVSNSDHKLNLKNIELEESRTKCKQLESNVQLCMTQLSQKEHELKQYTQSRQTKIDELLDAHRAANLAMLTKDKKIEELANRLATEMSNKVSADERSLENVSLKNRPMNIASEYEMICSNEWHDAKGALDDTCEQASEEHIKIKILRSIFLISQTEAVKHEQNLMAQFERMVHNPLSPVGSAQNTPRANKSLPNEIKIYIGDALRTGADTADISVLINGVKAQVSAVAAPDVWSQISDNSAFNRFIEVCVRLVWKMVLQRPPMQFNCDGVNQRWQGENYQDVFWGSSDPSDARSTVKYYVHPTLCHGGKRMVKGRVYLTWL